MLRSTFWATVAALTLWVGVTGTAHAQRGRWYGGGGSGGFYRGGGSYYGGWGGSRGYGYYPRSGFSIGIYSSPYRGYGYGNGGWGYGSPYYSSYGYSYPSYAGSSYGYSSPYSGSSYGYSSPYYSGSAYGYPGTVYSGDYAPVVGATYPDVTTTRSAYYAPGTTTAPLAENRARIHVRLPADAQLWVDEDATQQTGAERDFVTPPLTTGTTGTYTLKARWMQGNDPVERTMKVDVRPGETSQVDFMR